MYTRNYTRMKPWEKIKRWVEKGYLKPPKTFSIFKLYDVNKIPVSMSDKVRNYGFLYDKLFAKYPDIDTHIPLEGMDVESPINNKKSLANIFIEKQTKHMQKGFSEEKSFKMVEDEFAEELQKEKFERGLFEALAISNRSRSLMSYYEQEAEYETRQKLNQLQRMLPQYKRQQVSLEKVYDNLIRHEDKPIVKEEEVMKKYEPATCIVY
jgi:hypothetical protein